MRVSVFIIYPIRPNEDSEVLKKICHVPCKAGSVVVWDTRIPHSNSRRNDSEKNRAVVYASFLPDVPINHRYVTKQLNDYKQMRIPTDQWVGVDLENVPHENETFPSFTQFERKLLGVDSWDNK